MKIKKQKPNHGSHTLPKISVLTKKIRKTPKTKNLTKAKRKASAIVPWASSAEWDDVCEKFHKGDYKGMNERLVVWRARVPALPVGVEGTMFLIQAFCFDSKCDPFHPEEEMHARSLYSLALIRFMNHVSHLANQAIGGLALPMFQLASHDNYWKMTNSPHEIQGGLLSIPNDSPVIEGEDLEVEEDDAVIFQRVSDIISAYIASRVYHLRQAVRISDSEITKLWPTPSRPNSVTTKVALRSLKHAINNSLAKLPSITCTVIASELIPLPEFYSEFSIVFPIKPFARLCAVWNPILKLLQRKRKLAHVCEELVKIFAEESSKSNQRVIALWLKAIFKLIKRGNVDYSKELEQLVLPKAMRSINALSQPYFKLLLQLVKKTVGAARVQKLQTLGNILSDPLIAHDARLREGVRRNLKTVEDIINPGNCNGEIDRIQHGSVDIRGPEFWRNLPLGHVFHQ